MGEVERERERVVRRESELVGEFNMVGYYADRSKHEDQRVGSHGGRRRRARGHVIRICFDWSVTNTY
jgi:hypothetical protein